MHGLQGKSNVSNTGGLEKQPCSLEHTSVFVIRLMYQLFMWLSLICILLHT